VCVFVCVCVCGFCVVSVCVLSVCVVCQYVLCVCVCVCVNVKSSNHYTTRKFPKTRPSAQLCGQ